MRIFCPYTGKDIHEKDASEEHVIPESLGGSNGLTIRVQRDANSVLGTEVDGPVANQAFLLPRVRYNLRGKSGAAPVFSLPVTVDNLGGQRARWEPLALGSPITLEPRVLREHQDDGSTLVTVSGDPARSREIFNELKAAHERKGRRVKDVRETPIAVTGPTIRGQMVIDRLALLRFYPKLLLGYGHWLWQEEWSRSIAADRLRTMLWSKSLEEIDRAENGRMLSLSTNQMSLRLEGDQHLFLGMSLGARGYSLSVFLFGSKGFGFHVLPGETSIKWPDQSPIALIKASQRSIERLTEFDLAQRGCIAFPNTDKRPRGP